MILKESYAQKDLSRTYVVEEVENLSIDGNGVHSLKVITAKVEEISVRVHLEGETSEGIVIKEEMKGTQLALGFGAWPLAESYNDKLSAHKILSVEVHMTIPEHLFVSITSNTAFVYAEGTFKSLQIAIEDKNCVLHNFNGDAVLTTNRGSILVDVYNTNTNADATSTYGTVKNGLEGTGEFTIFAKSIHGDITLQQTQ